jgi:hypothetical protein
MGLSVVLHRVSSQQNVLENTLRKLIFPINSFTNVNSEASSYFNFSPISKIGSLVPLSQLRQLF